MQDIAWYTSIAGISWILFSFLFVYSRAGHPNPVAATAQERLRQTLFLVSIVFGVPLAIHTMASLPYVAPKDWSGPVQKIEVVGHQWNWSLSRESVPVGEAVEFRVTSADVNHGFAIYDPAMHVVAQTQAMPGYVNVLRHKFTEPGLYRIMCLEYCGVGHHAMEADFRVLPRPSTSKETD